MTDDTTPRERESSNRQATIASTQQQVFDTSSNIPNKQGDELVW
jgi:hypothetical protein